MSKIIRGTLDNKNRTILKQPEGGVGRVRCMKCQQLAVAQLGPDGKQQFKCQGCGAIIKSTPF
jgi:ribosomal protein S27E